MLSSDGAEFSWTLAAYTPIHGERMNLEQNRDYQLTNADLRTADTVVVHFQSGHMAGEYRMFTNGPWDDWADFYDSIAEWYDEY